MKKILILFVFLFQISCSFAQLNTPDCLSLKVDNIQLNTTQPNKMDITISNSCLDCMSGISGCVYLELEVLQTTAPLATIAASNCYCNWTPENNNSKTYTIDTNLTSLPDLNSLKVSLMAGDCGCSDLLFNSNLGQSNFANEQVAVFPNPTNSIVTVISKTKIKSIEIYDLQGRVIETLLGNIKSIDVSGKQNGIYFLKIANENGSNVEKLVKE